MIDYANISTRVKAAFIDVIVLIVMIYSISFIIEQFEPIPNYIRTIAFIFVFVLYEPLLVSISGATIGHFFNDIVVMQDKQMSKKLPFYKAFIRFIIKYLLGWVSLFTIHSEEQKKALHDLAVGSVVIPFKTYKKLSTKA